MLALVTGGHGFIGAHLCARLLAEGHQVRVLARPGSDLSRLAGLDVTPVSGDLTQSASLGAAVDGADWVFHLAGALKGFDRVSLMRVNRDGTRNLVAACLAHDPGLAKFILVSSLAAAGPSPGGGEPLTEDALPAPLTWYGESKLEAERAVLNAPALPSVILRPPVVFGPGDKDVYGYFRLASKGLLPIPGHGARHYSLVFAPDLADGILRAAARAVPSGDVFNLTGPEVVTWLELGQGIARALGRTGRVLHLPEALVRAAGRVADLAARAGGRPQIFSSQKVKEMLAPAWVASPLKAARDLGWTAPTSLDAALDQTVAWYRTHGWL
jgi:nucleoside-diphosphate-sugar epimerase